MGAEKKRVGRAVLYTPTAAEVTANGEGPWSATIRDVNTDGSVDLEVIPRTPTALTATSIAEADADVTYGAEERDLINELKARLDEVLARESERVKTSVVEGQGQGQFSFLAGSASV